MQLVEVTRTEPFEKLVWVTTNDPENERQEIHDRRKDSHPTESGWNGSQDPGCLPGTADQRRLKASRLPASGDGPSRTAVA